MSMHADDRQRRCQVELEYWYSQRKVCDRKIAELERWLTQYERHGKHADRHPDLLDSKGAQWIKQGDSK